MQAWVLGTSQIDKLVRINEAQPFMDNTKHVCAVIVGFDLPMGSFAFFIVRQFEVRDEV
jgi:hypothetical protein